MLRSNPTTRGTVSSGSVPAARLSPKRASSIRPQPATRRVMTERTGRPEDLKERGAWARQPERGSLALLRAMAWVSLNLGRRTGRCVLYLIVVYYFFFSPTAAHHSTAYLRRVLGREPRARDRFRQL